MADITITLSTPVLTAGQTFRYRHRLLPAGSFTAYANANNTPFTLTGLAEGTYEFEFFLLRADGSECPHTVKTFTVHAVPACIEAEAEMFSEANLHWLQVSYTQPPGYTPPDCGYELDYGPTGGTLTIISYATLPSSPFNLPASNAPYTVKLYAVSCDGSRKLCFEDAVAPVQPVCEPIEITNTVLTYDGAVFHAILTIVQSSPASGTVFYQYQQDNLYNNGGPDVNNGFYNLSPADTTITLLLDTNKDVVWTNGDKIINYTGTLRDGCERTHKWYASITLS